MPERGGMLGRRYLERGQPVTVLVRWRGNDCPRNVLVERADGTKAVRPFRGLRRIRIANQPED
jgi:acetyl esterase